MNTGRDVQRPGLYSSDCCGWERTFDKGDSFCRCPACSQLCEWELLEPVKPQAVPKEIDDRKQKVS